MDSIPLWGIFVASLAITLGPIELGFRIGRRSRARLTGDEKGRASPLAAASLSLLAFMLVIVFGGLESRFSELKHSVLEEANAIGTTFLRADLLPAAERAAIRGHLRDYVDLQIEVAQTGSVWQIEEAIQRSEELHTELWSLAVEIAAQAPTPVSALFVQSLNEVIDVHEKRVTLALHYRLPGFIWTVLFSLAILAMTTAGYDSGLSNNRRFIGITLSAAVAFSVVLVLVVALDRPQQHLSTATQAAMLDLQESIRSSMEAQP